MIKNIVDYLEITERKYGSKVAYCDENREITFSGLMVIVFVIDLCVL